MILFVDRSGLFIIYKPVVLTICDAAGALCLSFCRLNFGVFLAIPCEVQNDLKS